MQKKHLGLPDSIELRKHQNPAEDETTDRLLENLLNYGNFGSKQPFASEKSGESIRGISGIIKTGDLKEQLQYVRETKKMDSDLGIRTKEAGKGKGAKK